MTTTRRGFALEIDDEVCPVTVSEHHYPAEFRAYCSTQSDEPTGIGASAYTAVCDLAQEYRREGCDVRILRTRH